MPPTLPRRRRGVSALFVFVTCWSRSPIDVRGRFDEERRPFVGFVDIVSFVFALLARATLRPSRVVWTHDSQPRLLLNHCFARKNASPLERKSSALFNVEPF